MRKYENGDLLVIFNYANSSPSKGGVARIEPDGNPVWVRDDYSHHWPTLFTASDGEEVALVPGTMIEHVPVRSRLSSGISRIDIECPAAQGNQVDYVKLLGADGSVLQEIRIVDEIIESPFAAMLFHSTDPCDLLHLNYIDRIRDDVQGIPGVSPGDYVVSLRNISAFGIMDGETRQNEADGAWYVQLSALCPAPRGVGVPAFRQSRSGRLSGAVPRPSGGHKLVIPFGSRRFSPLPRLLRNSSSSPTTAAISRSRRIVSA